MAKKKSAEPVTAKPETRSVRLQVTVTPTTAQHAQELAFSRSSPTKRYTVSDLINDLLTAYLASLE